MRIRRLLLVHPSRSIRALIKKYIFTELSDIEIVEADTGRDGLDQINCQGFDVVISTDKLKDMAVNEFKAGQETAAINGHTPLIVISESESSHDRNELVQQGFDRVVQIRVRPADLIKKINAVCNPRHWRTDARYHIPNTAAAFNSSMGEIRASLINISMGGMLVELTTDHPCALIEGSLDATLHISLPENDALLNGLSVKLLRLETLAWNADNIPNAMRATFVFAGLKEGPRGRLAELLQMAKEDKLEAAEI